MLDLPSIQKWKRVGLLPSGHAARLVRSLVQANLDPRFTGIGNRARRRRIALERARERRPESLCRLIPTPASDRLHDERSEGYPRRHFRTNPHD